MEIRKAELRDIDDLCVDKCCHGKHVGTTLYSYILDFANYILDFTKSSNCYNVTLNIWIYNEGTLEFYKKMGLSPQKIGMGKIL